MRIKKYFICKRTTYKENGEREFELGQKYELVKKYDGWIDLKLNNETVAMTKEYFKENFKQKAIF